MAYKKRMGENLRSYKKQHSHFAMTMLLFGAVFFYLLYMPGDTDGTHPQMDTKNRTDGPDENGGMTLFQLRGQLFSFCVIFQVVYNDFFSFRRHEFFQCPEFLMIAAYHTCGDDAAIFDGKKGTDIQDRPDGLPDHPRRPLRRRGAISFTVKCVSIWERIS